MFPICCVQETGQRLQWCWGESAPAGGLLSLPCYHPRIRAPRSSYSRSRRQWVLEARELIMSAWPHRPLCLLQHLKIQIIRLVPAWLRMVNMWARAWAIHSDLLFATYSLLTKTGGRKPLRGRPRASGICVMLFSHRWFSLSVVSDSLWLHGLERARLLCPWGFSRQEYWSGLPCPLPGDLPNPGIEPRSPASQADSLPTETSAKSLFSRSRG